MSQGGRAGGTVGQVAPATEIGSWFRVSLLVQFADLPLAQARLHFHLGSCFDKIERRGK